MGNWILVPCLVTLRDEFNRVAPYRDKASDGSIGDTAHAASSTDHNPDDTPGVATPSSDSDGRPEVHAIDVDDDLKQAGWDMNRALQVIITRHRTGADDRLQNVIYNRRIWSRSWGWTAKAYNGKNAHTQHAHFSARYTAKQEADTRPWGLLVESKPKPPSKPGDPKPGSRTLKRGMTGPDVAYLRRWLGLNVGTVFDAKLEAAVERYQSMRGIASDGVVGPRTWAEIGVKT